MGPEDNRSIMPWGSHLNQIEAGTGFCPLPHGPAGALTRHMRVTKFEHAALTLEIDGGKLVIDPGSFTLPLNDLGKVVARRDHPRASRPLDPRSPRPHPQPCGGHPDLRAGRRGAGSARLRHHRRLPRRHRDRRAVRARVLRRQARRHPRVASPSSTTWGCSSTASSTIRATRTPSRRESTSSCWRRPIGAPWLKIGEAMDFVLAVAPRQAFGTHDMTLSVIGRDMAQGPHHVGGRAGRRRVPRSRPGRGDRHLTSASPIAKTTDAADLRGPRHPSSVCYCASRSVSSSATSSSSA